MPTKKGTSLYNAMRMCISSRVGMYRPNHVAYTHVHQTSDRVERNKRPSPFPPRFNVVASGAVHAWSLVRDDRARCLGFLFSTLQAVGSGGDE